MNTKFFVALLTSLVLGLSFQSCSLFQDQPGDNSNTLTVGGVGFNIVPVTGGYTFPTGVDNSGSATVAVTYDIATTETTYALWYAVYSWATTDAGNGFRADGGPLYTFANPGKEGSTGTIGAAATTNAQPVTTINWRDAIVWTNALTEYYNATNSTTYGCVYNAGGTPIRSSQDTNQMNTDSVTPDTSAKGFRLLTSDEWEEAARYQDGTTWTSGSYASGAAGAYTDEASTELVAWFVTDSLGTSNAVGTKTANTLGTYDMSGNVWEFCFDLIGALRVVRGGGWDTSASMLQVGEVSSVQPNFTGANQGFRIGKTAD